MCGERVNDRSAAPSVHDLPTEILVHIFMLAREPRPSEGSLGGNFEWIPTVTHVCRRWRSIAIYTPLLWNTIVTTGQERSRYWLPTMLARAAGTPLDVFVDHWTGDGRPKAHLMRETFELLLPHSSTFRTVFFKFDYLLEQDPSLVALVSQSLAQMTDVVDLRLTHHSFRPNGTPFPVDAMTMNRSGRLRHLRLSSYHFRPWTSPIYTSLRVLALAMVKSLPSLHEFLGILRACPGLEELKLDYCRSPVTWAASSFNPVVVLPKLRDISLVGLSSLAHLASRIEVSPVCRQMNIKYILHPENRADVTEVYSHLIPSATLYQPYLPQCKSLTFFSPSFYVSGLAGFIADGPSGATPSIDYSITLQDFELPPLSLPVWNAWLLPFVSLSARSLVRFAVMYHAIEQFTEYMWAAAFANFPFLESVQIQTSVTHLSGYYRQRTRPISSAAILRVSAALQRMPGTGLCAPRLCKLAFGCTVINNGIVEPFVRMLEWRAERGAASLGMLNLEWCQDTVPWKEHQAVVRDLQERVQKLGVTVSASFW